MSIHSQKRRNHKKEEKKAVVNMYRSLKTEEKINHGLLQVTDQNFDEVVLDSSVPVLVDFWAPWCAPCKAVAPVLEELAKEYKDSLRIVKYNTEENQRVAGAMNIRSIPTMVIFKNGTVSDLHIGASPQAHLKKWIDKTISEKKSFLSRLFN